MTKGVRVYARHVRGRPREGVKVPRYDLDNMILQLLAQRLAKLKHLPTDLSFYYVSGGFGLFLLGDLCTCDPFFPWRLGCNSEHPSLCLEAIFVALLASFWSNLMVITIPSREGSFIFICLVEATAPILFKAGLPNSIL